MEPSNRLPPDKPATQKDIAGQCACTPTALCGEHYFDPTRRPEFPIPPEAPRIDLDRVAQGTSFRAPDPSLAPEAPLKERLDELTDRWTVDFAYRCRLTTPQTKELRSRISSLISEARKEGQREAALVEEINFNGNTRGMSL